jgi:hypothetical protein
LGSNIDWTHGTYRRHGIHRLKDLIFVFVLIEITTGYVDEIIRLPWDIGGST